MSYRQILAVTLLALGAPITLLAAETSDPEVAALRQQVEELAKQVQILQQQLAAKPTALPAAPTPAAPDEESRSSGKEGLPEIPDTYPAITNPDFMEPIQTSSPASNGLAAYNPEISAAFDAIGSYSSQADNANFILRDMEVMVQANVDQLAHAYAVFNAETELDPWTRSDPFGEVSLGVEEAAIETTNLPWGLGLKAGQFFADFSRLGKVHSHALPFTDRPMALEGIIGGETKSRGVELSWIPRIDHYLRLTAGVVDNIGAETPVTGSLELLDGEEGSAFAFDSAEQRSLSELMFYGRAATVFELGDSVTLNTGLDYATGQDEHRMASTDFKLTWLPDPASYDRFVLGGEYLWGRSKGPLGPDAMFPGGPAFASASSEGGYLYAQYRFGKRWEPGIRYDVFHPRGFAQTDANMDGIADGIAGTGDSLQSLSAYLTWNLSEYNRLRFGVSHLTSDSDAFNGADDDWLGFLQWTVVLGPHKHSYQP